MRDEQKALNCRFFIFLAFCLVAALLYLAIPSFAEVPAPELAPVTAAPEQVSSPPETADTQPVGVTPYIPSEPPTGMQPIPQVVSPTMPPAEEPLPPDFIKISADTTRIVEVEEGEVVITATGNVVGKYSEFSMTSERAVYDTRTGIAVFEKNVSFYYSGQVAHGEKLTLNAKTREWQVETAKTTLTPDFFEGATAIIGQPLVIAPLFLSGATIFGEDSRQVTVGNGSFTTCNFDPPHYSIEAREVLIYPNNKVIARKINIYALGHRILSLPRLAFPLRRIQGRPDIIPRVGQSGEEGYYAKTAYNYKASQNQTGVARIDLMTRKGIAEGLTHTYNLARGAGELYLYHLNDRTTNLSTLTGRLQHKQQIGTVAAELMSDIRDNSYQYAPNTISTSNELRLTRDRLGANTSLGLRQSSSRGLGGLGNFETIGSSFLHRQSFGQRSNLNIGADLSESFSPQTNSFGQQVQATSGQLNSRVEFQRLGDKFDWGVSSNWITNLSDEEFFGSQFAGIERQPELSFRTDTYRFGPKLPTGIRANLGLTLGQYREEPAHIQTQRGLFELNTTPTKLEVANKTTLTTSAGFRQYAYGDDTAQYALNTNTVLEKRIGEKSSAALTYRYLNPRGFTPFRFDFLGEANVLTGSYNLKESDRFKLSLLSGYDFRLDQNQWQDITLRLLYSPSPIFAAYTSTGFDINRSKWRSVINQFRIRHPNGLRMDIGTRYDTISSKFASIKTQIDTPIGKLWHLQGVAGYNGFSKNFDYRSVMLTRDLHCWEASLIFTDQSGFFQQNEIRLNVRIKAFPLFEQFGVGAFGQSLDTSVGDIY